MKYLFRVMNLTFIILIFTGCNRSRDSWQFVMDKGGIIIGDPYQYKSSTYLPIKCNASGLEAIFVKPVDTTSYPIFFTHGKAVLVDNNIEIKLYHSMEEGGKDINRIKIPDLKPGVYSVFYNDKKNSKVFIDKVTY